MAAENVDKRFQRYLVLSFIIVAACVVLLEVVFIPVAATIIMPIAFSLQPIQAFFVAQTALVLIVIPILAGGFAYSRLVQRRLTSELQAAEEERRQYYAQRNLMLSDKSDLVAIEADEFDRSFHTLSPYMAVITSCDPDHLDIYGTEEAYRESFAHFTELIRPGGLLLKHRGIKVDCRPNAEVRYAEYDVVPDTSGLNDSELPDFYATNVRIGNGTILFDFVIKEGQHIFRDLEPGVPAPINVDNATAALAICWLNGCTEDELRKGLKSFGGAKRRFDFYIKRPDLVVMDDYAHHPDEIRASLHSVRQLFAGRHLTLCFQPHLYSRTHDLVDGFASALAIPDRTILLPIYPAREQPMPGVTSQWLLDKIDSRDKSLVEISALVPYLVALRKAHQLDVLVMMGAGVDIERLVAPATEALADL